MKKRTILANCLAVALISGWHAPDALAATRIWNVPSGNWGTAGSWNAAVVPVGGDLAQFSTAGTFTATFQAAPTAIGDLTVSAGTVTLQSANVVGAPFTLGVNSGGVGNLSVTGATTILNLGGSGTNGAVIVNPVALDVRSGANLNINFGSDVVVGASGTAIIGNTGGAGTMTVDGTGSLFSNTSGSTVVGFNSNSGTLNFQNGASGTLFTVNVANSGASSNGILNLLSGSSVTTGSITVSGTAVAASGTINVNGASSLLQQSGASTIAVGTTVSNTGAINIGTTNTGGTFTTGTGTINVNATGTINIGNGANTGTFNANGNVVINGGQFNRGNGSTFALAASKTFTVQSGGDATFFGGYITTGGTHTVTGVGSQLNVSTGSLLVRNNVTLNVQSGGTAISGGAGIGIGDATAPGTMNMDGTGTTLTATAGVSFIGGTAGTSSLTMTNSAQASFAALTLGNGSTAGSIGNVSVVSGADITALGNLSLSAANNSAGSSNLFAVSDFGSIVSQTGASTLTVGAAATPTGAVNATLIATANGVFNTGTGTTTVNGRGKIEMNGGIINANGNVVIDGGLISRLSTAGSSFNWATAKTMTVQNGGTFTHAAQYTTPANSIINVTGAGSSFNVTSTALVVQDDAQISAANGGDLVLAGLALGFTSAGEMTVDGGGSTLTVSGGAPSIGSVGGNGILTVTNGGFASFNSLNVGNDTTANTTGLLAVIQGADVTISNSLNVAQVGGAFSSGTVSVEGIGSSLTVTGGTFNLGHLADGVAEATFNLGASFSAPATTLNSSAGLNINFATVDLGVLTYNGGTVNFSAGSLSYIGDLTVGLGGLFGDNDVVLGVDKSLTLTGTTTVSPFQSLSIVGGKLTTGALVVNGNLDFEDGGTLVITGAGGLTIGSGGPLGTNPTLSGNVTLNVVNTLAVNAGSTATLAGGHVIAGTLANNGSIILDSGSITAGTLTNNAGAFVYVGQNKTATFNSPSTNAGEIQLGGGAATLAGTGTIINTGLIRGDGRIVSAITNSTGGEIRAESGKRLKFEAFNGTTVGKINLQGGTAEFTQPLTNGANGLITGRGTLMVGGTGLNNLGNIALSSGITDVFGDVVNNTGVGTKGVQISGNADVTFWDDVTNTSGLFRVSAGSSASFFGTYGGGGITGTGDVYFEGDITPGFSPANITLQPNVFFGPGSTLVMELDGLTLGTQYDHINFQGATALDGTLEVISSFTLNAGNSFDLFDGTLTGTFDTLNLPVLGGGLIWNTSNLYSTGTIFVVAPGPNSWQGAANALWSATGSWTSGTVPSTNTDTALFANAPGAGSPIVLDSNQTINALRFNSTNSYTINPQGAQVLSLSGIAPTITTEVGNTGTQTVAVALNLGNNTTINANAGTLSFNTPAVSVIGTGVTANVANGAALHLGGAASTLNNTVPVTNAGTLNITGPAQTVGNLSGSGTTNVTTAGATLTANHIRQATLNIGAGNTVTVASNGGNSGTSVVTNLSINATGKLDLANNDLVVDNGNLATLTAKLASGLDINGTYGNGPGITSSAFASNPNFNTVLGIAANVELGYTNFSGQTVDANDVLIKYTYYGDADLSGSVDTSTDFDLYITGLTSGGSLGGWLFGDFDYSGTVDSSTDFDLYITGLTTQGGPLLTAGGGGNVVQAVPEPSTLVLAGLGILGFAGAQLRRRREEWWGKKGVRNPFRFLTPLLTISSSWLCPSRRRRIHLASASRFCLGRVSKKHGRHSCPSRPHRTRAE